MAIESAVMFRRVARTACLVLLAGLLPGVAAKAQLPITPPAPVSVGSVVPFSHGSTGEWVQIYSMKEDLNSGSPAYGNVLFLDSAASVIYQMSPGASTPSVVVEPEPSNKDASDCSALEYKGSYWNAAIAFDKWDNLYVTDRYGSAVQFCRVPYSPSAGTWIFNKSDIWGQNGTVAPSYVNSSGQTEAIPSQDLEVADDGVTFYVSDPTADIYKFTVNEAGVASNVTALITGLEEYATYLAVDHAGDLFFVENTGAYPDNVQGIREITAAQIAKGTIVGDSTGTAESALPRIDQGGGWDGITGMFIDPQGNMYYGSAYNLSYGGEADGVYMIPNEGTPTAPNLVWNDTVMVSPVDGGFAPLVDPRGFVWIATSYNNNWYPSGVNGPSCDSTDLQTQTATCVYSTMVVWKPGALNLGSTPVGGATPTPISTYSVSTGGGTLTLTANNSYTEGEIVTISAPSGDALYVLNGLSFEVLGTGLSSSAFEVSTSTIAAGASGSTSATVTLNQTQALYYMFNKATTLSSPGGISLQSPSSANFQNVANYPLLDNPPPTNPGPVEPCQSGASYPAFSAEQKTSAEYGWCPYYFQLNSSSAGTVETEAELNNSSGVIPGSNAYVSGTGQGAAISVVSSPTILSLASELNTPRQVAADHWGNTYVADSALKAIEFYPAGTTSPTAGKISNTNGTLSAPTGVAVDGVGNLYIGDSGNIYEIPSVDGKLVTSEQTLIASGLGKENLNLAVDGQGDVFVADEANKQVVEIPNPQANLLMVSGGYPQITLGTGFTGPTAIATDTSGNVWVADGGNLYEISMPFGGNAAPAKLATGLQGVTGIAVDPSSSVFVAGENGLEWIPWDTTTGALNTNAPVVISSALGSGPAAPWGVALDGSQNVYADYGSGSTAGLAQLGIGGTVNFNNGGVEINPNVPIEVDAQILNLGNVPLEVSDNPAIDLITGTSASDYAVISATQGSPACSSSTPISQGGSCYLGMQLDAPAADTTSASINVVSNAVNAAAGVNIAVSGDVVVDLRPATTAAITVAPATGTGCSGILTYPGCVTIQVTVVCSASGGANCASAGTPQGNVTLSVGSANGNLAKQTEALGSDGSVTFTYNGLLGGTYTVSADYGGYGTAGATQNTCSTSTCFAGSAVKATFTIAQAVPTIALGVPMTSSQCLNATTLLPDAPSSTSCTANPNYVTVYNGSTYVLQTGAAYVSAVVTSPVGTPTGTVSFCSAYANGTCTPADPTQGINGAVAVNANGVATFSLANLNTGVYNLTAVYSGDVNYMQETPVVSQFEVIVQSIQITAPSGTVNITPGTPTQVALTLMPLVGFGSSGVSLECNSADAPIQLAATNPVSTLPEYSECTFNYANTSTGTSPVGEDTAQITAYSASGGNLTLTASNNFPAGAVITMSATQTDSLYALNKLSFTVLPTGLSSTQFEVSTSAISGSGSSSATATGPQLTTVVMTISTNVAANGPITASIARQEPWSLAGLFGLGLLGLIAGRKRLTRYMAMICVAMVLSGLFMGITACTNAGYSTPPSAPKVATPAGSYNVQIITYNPEALTQSSLTTPIFTLPVSVQ